MIPQDYLTLMHGEIDGTNAPADSRRLAEYLAAHPEARTHYAELKEAVGIIERTPSLAPPPHLRRQILAAADAIPIPGATPTPTRIKPTAGFRNVLSSLRTRSEYRYAFAAGFAVCLALGAVAWQVAGPVGQPAPDDLRGTILRDFTAGGTAEESAVIDAAGIAGAVQVHHAGTRTLVQLELTSDRPVEIGFVGDGPLACEVFRATPPVAGPLSFTDRRLSLSHAGQGLYEFVLTPRNPNRPGITLQIVDADRVLFEQTLTRKHIDG